MRCAQRQRKQAIQVIDNHRPSSIIRLFGLLLLVVGQSYLIGANSSSGQQKQPNQPFHQQQQQQQLVPNEQSNSNLLNNNNQARINSENGIYLESMDDLEHVAYLSMRNFNITDEGLMESSWLLNLATNAKQHQKVVVSAASASAGGSSIESGETSTRDRLASMLESFILHLRNGHLRQLKLDELKGMVGNYLYINSNTVDNGNLTQQRQRLVVAASPSDSPTNEATLDNETVATASADEQRDHSSDIIDSGFEDESHERCAYLVSLYVQELRERQKRASNQQQQQQQVNADISSNQSVNGSESQPLFEQMQPSIDQARLIKLCRLVVQCHNADDLVGLLNGPWQDRASSNDGGPIQKRSSPVPEGEFVTAAEPDRYDAEQDSLQQRFSGRISSGGGGGGGNSRRSLRDSLSQSLAKLCPLMLFQLHDEDGMCSFRKDDRPPMITVWGFATLFVTIVSFCSLIGLSITPLLGPSATDRDTSLSCSSSDLSSASNHNHQHHHHHHQHHHHDHNHQHRFHMGANKGHQYHHQHRECLTLFEGLAVGSLVGSALFSLIPQAFELQERESNQGFLLKALIIFFGIYLFFCSERIMRIILDTRHHRKRKQRGSTSVALPSTTVDVSLVGFADQANVNFSPQRSNDNNNNNSNTFQPINFNQQQHRSGSRDQLQAMGSFSGGGSKLSTATKRQLRPAAGTRLAANKCVNFPASQLQGLQEEHQDLARARQQRRRRERIKSTGGGTGQTTAAAAAIKSERSQAAKRHQSRRRRSAIAGRRRRRKTRYQLLVQSKRLHSSGNSLTLPADHPCHQCTTTTTAAAAAGKDHTAGSLGSRVSSSTHNADGGGGGGGSSRGSLDSTSSHYSGYSLAEESYDSTTSLNSSSSSDSDEELYRPARNNNNNNQRISRHQQQQQQQQMRSTSGQPGSFRAKPPATLHSESSRRLATFHLHDGPEESKLYSRRHTRHSRARSSSAAGGEPSQAEKQDISTVAWMIILGDGLHNFIDGISIGAAFSESILSGVSISVAVICEEFPHELGDFAVLVSSGMTVRQALGYNFLSACTCYFGMAIGIILGDVNDGASYISALAAGVFLYIALVDMMGELSASLEESSRDSIGKTLKLLLLQNVGIFIGISIILVLSFIDF